MGYFNRDTSNRSGRDNSGGGRGFGGGGRDSARRNDGPREMFKTVCSSCGKECEVPFKPTNGKPVYCSECFDRISPRTDRPERSERNDKRSLSFQDRPRRDNGPRREERPQAPRVDYSAQFELLNSKIDKLIDLLTPKVEEKVVKTPRAKKIKLVEEK